MTTYNWLCLLGAPALVGAVWAYIAGINRQIKAVKAGTQALLRAHMISDWQYWSEKGYAPIYARQSFENVWEQYEKLGKNGVMQDIHNRFLSLPTKED